MEISNLLFEFKIYCVNWNIVKSILGITPGIFDLIYDIFSHVNAIKGNFLEIWPFFLQEKLKL